MNAPLTRLARIFLGALVALTLIVCTAQSGVRGLSRLVASELADDDDVDPLDEGTLTERTHCAPSPSPHRQVSGVIARADVPVATRLLVRLEPPIATRCQRLPTPPPRLLL